MLHSRAFLLLEREFVELKQAKIFGINVMAIEDNWMEWIAEIEGLKDTLWEGAELQLSLKYSEDYNAMPPTITFTTIPFHPNGKDVIEDSVLHMITDQKQLVASLDPESGRPCVDFLDNFSKWNTRFTMTSILLTIQQFLLESSSKKISLSSVDERAIEAFGGMFVKVLLSNPVLNNAVNLEAAEMLRNNYPLYREKVVQCVTNSKQLEAIAKDWDTSIKFCKEPKEPAPQRTRAISYEEYFITWFKIATSRPAEDFKHPVFDDPEYIGNRYNWMAENVNRGSWDENLHNIFVSDCIEKQKKQIMLENLGGKCIIPASEAPSKATSVGYKKMEKNKNEEHWEDEVEGLVTWSTNLDQAKLD